MSGIDRAFAYAVPEELVGIIRVGCMVRVVLNGRRVRGWVVAEAGELPPGIDLRQVSELVSLGPPQAVVELARWASWRYAGRLRPLLMAASPPRLVRSLPAAPSVATPSLPAVPRHGGGAGTPLGEEIAAVTTEGLSFPVAVLRLPPAAPRLVVVEAAIAARGKERGPARPGSVATRRPHLGEPPRGFRARRCPPPRGLGGGGLRRPHRRRHTLGRLGAHR